MHDICLIRQDGTAEVINIRVGDVTIGRGPILKCTDKRVSRNHGVITLSETGDVILKATHVNPIYYKGKDGTSQQIGRDNFVILRNGDEFALLPDCYQFRVTSISENSKNGHSENDKIGESNARDEIENIDPVKIKEEPPDSEMATSSENCGKDTNRAVQNMDSTVKQEPDNIFRNFVQNYENENVNIFGNVQNADAVKKEPVESSSENNVPMFSFYNHKRILPAWMTASSKDDASKCSTKASGASKVNKTSKPKKNTTNKAAMPKKKGKNDKKDISDDELDKNGESNTDKVSKEGKLHEMSDEEDTASTRMAAISNKRTPQKRKGKAKEDKTPKKKGKADEVDTANVSSDKESTSDKEDLLKDKEGNPHELSDEDENVEQADDEENTLDPVVQTVAAANQGATSSQKRQKCLYGANCYRMNPRHRVDFSHPGDSDYEVKDIPECPYGKTCYRKNKQHRLDFKHTTRPRKAKRTQTRQKRDVLADDDEEDDYDYDDPFLNDASSDDYQPTDSGSDLSADPSSGDEEEDSRRMIKEAKKFTRKKK